MNTADLHSGVGLQEALRECEIVAEERITDGGPGEWYFLKLGHKLIPLGKDVRFADSLRFALRRNAEAFDTRKQRSTTTLCSRRLGAGSNWRV